MGKRKRNIQRKQRQERRFRVRGERRDPPDMRKLGRALISLAQAELEREAQAAHDAEQHTAKDGDATDAKGETPDD